MGMGPHGQEVGELLPSDSQLGPSSPSRWGDLSYTVVGAATTDANFFGGRFLGGAQFWK